MTTNDPEPAEQKPAYEPFTPDALEWDDVRAGECPYDRETKILQAIEWEDQKT